MYFVLNNNNKYRISLEIFFQRNIQILYHILSMFQFLTEIYISLHLPVDVYAFFYFFSTDLLHFHNFVFHPKEFMSTIDTSFSKISSFTTSNPLKYSKALFLDGIDQKLEVDLFKG